MIIVLGSIVLMIFLLVLLGSGASTLLGVEPSVQPEDRMLLGVWLIVVLGGWTSLLVALSVWVQLAVLALAALSFVRLVRSRSLGRAFAGSAGGWTAYWLPLVLALLWVHRLAGRGTNYDTGAYHVQAVLWVREHGVVPGIANLIPQLGLDSAWWVFSAMFEPPGAGLGAWHFIGFASLTPLGLVAGRAMCESWKRHALPTLAQSYAILALFGVIASKGALASYSPDPVVAHLTLYLGYLLLAWSQAPTNRAVLPVLIAVSALTAAIKPSGLVAVVTVPLVLLFATRWRGTAGRETLRVWLGAAALGLATILPYWIRSLVISGWILFPSSVGGVWNFEWQVADAERAAVFEFVRCDAVDSSSTFHSCGPLADGWPFRSPWGWFEQFSASAMHAAAFLLLLPGTFVALLAVRGMKRFQIAAYLSVLGFFLAACLYWYALAPAARFGTGWLFGAVAVMGAPLLAAGLQKSSSAVRRLGVVVGALVVCVAAVIGAGWRGVWSGREPLRWLTPAAAPAAQGELHRTELESGLVLTYAVGSNFVSDEPPPVLIWIPAFEQPIPGELPVRALGPTIRGGFARTESWRTVSEK